MNSTKRDRIIDRIQKLLALANSSNEHEARAAAEKVTELTVQYNLDLQQVRAAGGDMGQNLDDDYEARDIYNSTRRTPQQRYIFPLLRHFFVKAVSSKSKRAPALTIILVGEKANVAVAQYVHDFLLVKFPELWHDYRKRTGAPVSARKSYYAGLCAGLDAQLSNKRKSVENETGLVVVADPNLQRYMDQQFGDLKRARRSNCAITDTKAYHEGCEDGGKVKINRALGGTSEPQGQPLALAGKAS